MTVSLDRRERKLDLAPGRVVLPVHPSRASVRTP
jgi:hypothetical protein